MPLYAGTEYFPEDLGVSINNKAPPQEGRVGREVGVRRFPISWVRKDFPITPGLGEGLLPSQSRQYFQGYHPEERGDPWIPSSPGDPHIDKFIVTEFILC